jgi:hypothetical protein
MGVEEDEKEEGVGARRKGYNLSSPSVSFQRWGLEKTSKTDIDVKGFYASIYAGINVSIDAMTQIGLLSRISESG